MKTITNSLVLCALKSDSSPTRDLHHLLASLQQRHPELVQEVSRSLIEEDEDQQEAIQQLVLSLSVVRSVYSLLSYLFFHALRQKTSHEGDVPEVDMVVASMDANAETRAAAIQSMLRTLRQSTGLDPQNLVGTSVYLLRTEAYVHRPIFSRSLYVLRSLHVYTILLSPYSRHCTPIRRSFSLSYFPIRPRSSRLSPKRSPRSLSRLPVLSCACTFLSSLYT